MVGRTTSKKPTGATSPLLRTNSRRRSGPATSSRRSPTSRRSARLLFPSLHFTTGSPTRREPPLRPGVYHLALTAACALGERILNHLVLTLRDEFRSSPEFKRIYRSESFDNWEVALRRSYRGESFAPSSQRSFARWRRSGTQRFISDSISTPTRERPRSTRSPLSARSSPANSVHGETCHGS